MGRGRKCKKFEWRWTDPAFIAEHRNNLQVFKKIKRKWKRGGGRSLADVIEELFQDPVWGARMRGKKRRSWKVNFFRWVRQL